jgi:alpha-amylase
MFKTSTKLVLSAVLCLGLIFSASMQSIAQKVVLQGFWWDYWNSNYPNAWANYLSNLAPRLKAMGIDAVWIPPTLKCQTQGVGYSPFDHYDLGDKYQKGFLPTRVGTKDELLRMVAVLHANGMDVIQDIVLNHVDGAGSASGAGGQDPAAWEDWTTSKYKNFRYVSYTSPASNETAANYLARNGRFPKNWQNFHPNPADNSISGDWNAVYWGPDISYVAGAYGQSSNATFNPAQTSNHMRNGMRNWIIWYKKQVGWDGVRLDAVKHFPDWVTEDYMWNLQHNAGWASGGNTMFAVGEYVGGKSQLDGWCNNVNNRAGTFDFALRDGIYAMITSGGHFNIGTIPGYQQNNRVFHLDGQWVHRTVPFVNNHDTFRPQLGATGNYVGWNHGDQLAPHIDPFDPRLSAAYAIVMAVDGSPQIFFEDLFNIGNTGKRWSHQPTNTVDLPVRGDIANLIWCHQNLRFKDGAYRVRFQHHDHLVIERSARAIISINDNWNTWQGHWVATDFAPGTRLKDYSGANGNAIRTVDHNGWVYITTPPCDGTALQGRRGYAVWGPDGINTHYNLPERTTTQEWELADDLGDNHASSLRQGGQLPAGSTALRTAGRIFVQSGKPVHYEMFPSNPSRDLQVLLYNAGGSILSSRSGTGTLTGSYTPNFTGWITIRARNNSTSNPAQRVWIKVTYTGPTSIGGAEAAEADTFVDTEAQTEKTDLSAQNAVNLYPNPTVSSDINLTIESVDEAEVTLRIVDITGKERYTKKLMLYRGSNSLRVDPRLDLEKGIYTVVISELNVAKKLMITQ